MKTYYTTRTLRTLGGARMVLESGYIVMIAFAISEGDKENYETAWTLVSVALLISTIMMLGHISLRFLISKSGSDIYIPPVYPDYPHNAYLLLDILLFLFLGYSFYRALEAAEDTEYEDRIAHPYYFLNIISGISIIVFLANIYKFFFLM